GASQPRQTSSEFGVQCRTAISRVADFARTGDAMESLRFGVDPIDLVPFPQSEIQVSGRRLHHGARTVQRCRFDWRILGGRLRLAGARPGFNDPRIEMQSPDSV